MKHDIVVIGAGAVGLCCAHELRSAGHNVAVIDRGQPGSGASDGNAGLIVPSHFIPLAAPGVIGQGIRWMLDPGSPFYIKPRLDLDLARWLWHFARSCTAEHVARSMPLLRDLHLGGREAYGDLSSQLNDTFHHQRQGLLMLFRSSHGEAECRNLVNRAPEVDLSARMVTHEELAELDPALAGAKCAGGAFFPLDAHLDPAAFITALIHRLETAGVPILSDRAVTAIRSNGNRPVRIDTTEESLDADQVVLAGGTWSPALTRGLGLRMPIQGARGYSVTIVPGARQHGIPLILAEAKVAVTPMGERLRFAGTLELAGLKAPCNPRRVRGICAAVPDYLPSFSAEELLTQPVWEGFRPCSPDGLPYLGRLTDHPRVIAATGHAMIGISLAPITGRLVADIIAERPPRIEIGLLRPERFC